MDIMGAQASPDLYNHPITPKKGPEHTQTVGLACMLFGACFIQLKKGSNHFVTTLLFCLKSKRTIVKILQTSIDNMSHIHWNDLT